MEITASIRNIRVSRLQQNGQGEWIVADAVEAREDGKAGRITLVGVTSHGHPRPGVFYKFEGTREEYRPLGGEIEQQFKFTTCSVTEPRNKSSVILYLQQAKGVGPRTARKLVDALGPDTMDLIRGNPAEVVKRAGIRRTMADELQEHFQSISDNEETMIALGELFDNRGFPKDIKHRVHGKYAAIAPYIIRQNPYLLMQFRGIGFRLADALYLSLEKPPHALKRQVLCGVQTLESSRSGDTWMSYDDFAEALEQQIGGTTARPRDALRLGVRAKLFALKHTENGRLSWDGPDTWVALKRNADNEEGIKARIETIYGYEKDRRYWPFNPEDLEVSDHQREQIARATTNKIGILCGGPGTGKTYTTAKVIGALQGRIGIAAPTGKAAVRLAGVLSEHGIIGQPMTWHRMLAAKYDEDRGFTFEYGPNNPMPYDYIIGDETSMMDARMMDLALSATKDSTRVLLVGDTNQLLPVGHGAPLRDLMPHIPVGELTEIRRNSGAIVQACHEIRQGVKIDPPAEGNLVFCDTPYSDIASEVVAIANEVTRDRGYDPIYDVQVIGALNDSGDCSIRNLNLRMKRAFGNGPSIDNCPFAVGDKVVCTKNTEYDLLNPSGPQTKAYVANGEQGVISSQSKTKRLAIKFRYPDRLVWVPRGSGRTDPKCNIMHAYAITCHKSQGSEWPVVIVALDESRGAGMICNREWLYTAISRGKQLTYLVGRLGTAHKFQSETGIDARKTFLQELLYGDNQVPFYDSY